MSKVRSIALACLLILVAFTLLPAAPVAGAEQFTVVISDAVNVRAAPSTDAAILDTLAPGDQMTVAGQVAGEQVLDSNSTWWRTASGGYVYSAYTTPVADSSVSSDGMTGRWIEVDRSALVARAVENGNVVYTAPVTLGTASYPTPSGTFYIHSRVANETMDSSTVGIPRNVPGGYYLTGVLYTQYFTDAVAIHYNYWSPPEAFGHYPGSHGCVGMQLADAAFFWSFGGIGTPVIVY